ncbi:MAG: glycosyltransferase family 39 protein, partial [Chloroflexi bacterium]|nr:glycosyltransferase family 39 protein [Chloroflexota bacterium]
MTESTNPRPASVSRPTRAGWTVLFGLWMLHGAIALWQFANLPSDPHSFLFGFSPIRLLVFILLLIWILLLAGCILFPSRSVPFVLRVLTKPGMRDSILVTAFLMILIRVGLGILAGLWSGPLALRYEAYAERLLPIFDLAAFVSLEIWILAVVTILRKRERFALPGRDEWVRLLVILLVLGSLAALVAGTGWGIDPVSTGDWSRGLPAVPLLEWQIVLGCLFCLGMFLYEGMKGVPARTHMDVWICILIYLGTAAFWLSQPVVPNASALAPHGPNYEIYPFIDSQVYDGYAQSILVGNGLGGGKIPQRPLYLVFLAIMHVLVGQEYQEIILVQTLIWAFFPVLLYLFGREFFGRPMGISIALLAILRDTTSNLVSPFTGNISYTKLYLSEIPTAMLLILFLLIGMRWVRAGFPAYLGFLMGGILGVGMLIRTQVIVALPVMLMIALLTNWKAIKPLIHSSLITVFMMVLVVSPWLWRNWNLTGELIFDDPGSQVSNLALRYNRLIGRQVNVMPLSDESNIEYNDRLTELASEAFEANPRGVIRAISSSFLNHGVNNILLFPLRDEISSFDDLWIPTHAFWERWEGTPSPIQQALLVGFLLLFGFGLTAAWSRNGWLGFLPL